MRAVTLMVQAHFQRSLTTSRVSMDRRQRTSVIAISINGSIGTKWNFRFNPFVVIESGPPFDITVGRDLYGTTLFNARPGIPIDLCKPGLIATAYGLLDPNPTADQTTLTRNFGLAWHHHGQSSSDKAD